MTSKCATLQNILLRKRLFCFYCRRTGALRCHWQH